MSCIYSELNFYKDHQVPQPMYRFCQNAGIFHFTSIKGTSVSSLIFYEINENCILIICPYSHPHWGNYAKCHIVVVRMPAFYF
jgi:hypothetical protein